MAWKIWFWFAVAILILGCIGALCLKKRGKRKSVTPLHVMLCSVFVSAFVLFCPIYNASFAGEGFQPAKAVLWSLYSTIRLFILEGDLGLVSEYMTSDAGWMYTAYTGYSAILLVLAPFLTFGVVLTFFKNLSARCRYLTGYFKDVYVFSELNEKSVLLAESLKNTHPGRLLVFTDVSDEEGTCSGEMLERTKVIDAICFKKDIHTINFRTHSKRRNLYFFAMREKEEENVEDALKLIERYREIPNTHLYVFATQVEGELLLTAQDKGKIKVRRVNEARSLVNRILYESGETIFKGAITGENGMKHISAVVVGMGSHGTCMVKALSWFCQMDGYGLTLDVFDKDPRVSDRLYVQCPELISERYNGVSVPGEAQYRIRIHGAMATDSRAFAEEIAKLKKATYVLVSLGSDEVNIRAAVYLRMLFERNGAKPVIQAIVYNSDKIKALAGITNYRGQSYDIDFIGDQESACSEAVILNSELEKEALKRHLKWGSEEDFWKYEYNYSSSVASAIHMKVREALGVPGAGKREEDLTEAERAFIEILEHRRWNAYMRSEGYVYSGSSDPASRNDLGKMHHDLVEFELLSEEDKRKDSRVGSR